MLPVRISLRSGRYVAIGLLACCGTMLCVSASVLAQARYGSMPVYAKMDERDEKNYDAAFYRGILNDKRKILIGTLPYEDPKSKAIIRGWYQSYYIPSMTQLDSLDKLPEKRIELLKDLRSIRSDAVHKPVLELVYGLVKSLTLPSFKAQDGTDVPLHPAVRYNAMLLLGDLNVSEAKGTQQPDPYPYPPAFSDLVKTAMIDESQPDYLKMAAMVGILRHAKLLASPRTPNIPDGTRKKLIELLMQTANQKTPPATVNRSAEGHTWMRRRSIEIAGILGGLSLADTADSTSTSLQAIVADQTEPPSLRCTAASTLRLTPGNAKVNSLQASEKLGSLATQICRRELAWIDAELAKQPKLAADGSGGYGATGMGSGMPGMPAGMPGYGTGGSEMSGPGMPAGMPGYGTGGSEMSGMDMMGGPGMGGYGGLTGVGAPADPRLDLARRRLKYQLICVSEGLDGVRKINAPADQSGQRKKILDRFAAIMAATDLVKLEPTQPKSLETLAMQVRTAMTSLEAITGGPPAEKEAEATAPAISAQPGGLPAAGPAAIPAGPATGPAAIPTGPATGPAAIPAGPAAGPDPVPATGIADGPADAPAAP